MLGIGGGGDVVGALAAARLCQSFGTEFRLGGVAWERFPVDPYPGPRSIDQIRGGRRLGPAAVLADENTTTPDGVAFSESRMAAFICTDTVLLDISGGPAAVADAIAGAAETLDCDLCLLLDVGGDVLAHGDEPGLASPLCDAIMLAAGARLAERMPTVAAVYGAGCDGELTPSEVLDRIAELGRAGALLGAWGLTPAVAEQIEAAARTVPTEASLMAVRCARGETGTVLIRSGKRRVELTPLGGLTFFFDPALAVQHAAPLARSVADAPSLDAAQAVLAAAGVRTELDLERERARGENPALE
ncbi:MAG: DUF1152 domain-containing protein [Solirubrobacterales bacterium]